MQTEEIRLDLPADVARAFRDSSPDEQARIREIVRLSLAARTDPAAFDAATDRLERTVARISQASAARGASEALIDRLLNDE
jgi:hypothetical protein